MSLDCFRLSRTVSDQHPVLDEMDHVGTSVLCLTNCLLCWLTWAATLSVGNMRRQGCVRVFPAQSSLPPGWHFPTWSV